MESTKNLCAQVPISLHEKIRAEQEQSGQTLSQYITQIITEYYERGTMKNMSDSRTMAIQISDELFERLKSYLKTNGISQKQFLTELIEKALDEANA
ncbi:4-oxalocrotonate tautomerase [Oscillibacter sp.]|jgi:predicted DNA-binding protein|uniref:4-oxalocrotonate tautomerase n=1 Tax=Oscillibacter sp. TaxID=1945593 RepID=UPI00289F9E78|nr:4-oxalocrotonate tautomerase [Oscillibacter sp.]